MPQELRVVRCFQCLKYQVDIVKKANKWVCKLCGVKQSLAREFFRGSGKDCRSMVQQLSMRNLDMDRQEAEVTKLVLENKIQLPKPPMETVPVMERTETNGVSQGPSKWETFLTKESNDDLSDAVCSSESFESVSSTTFDRERINNPATSARDCNYRPLNREMSWNNEQQRFPNINNEHLSRNKSAIRQKKPLFNPVRSASKTTHNTFFQNADGDKRCNNSGGNDTMALPSFHRKENISSQTFQKPAKKMFSQANTVHKPSTPEVASSSNSYKPSEMPCKRKVANVFATPLMNFGKRTVVESEVANSPESLGSAIETEPPAYAKPASVSSKWAKYLPEDDATNENADNNFIIF